LTYFESAILSSLPKLLSLIYLPSGSTAKPQDRHHQPLEHLPHGRLAGGYNGQQRSAEVRRPRAHPFFAPRSFLSFPPWSYCSSSPPLVRVPRASMSRSVYARPRSWLHGAWCGCSQAV
jgi:hypothetical protein